MSGIAYASVGTTDFDRAKAFYDALLPLAGITKMFDHPSGGRVYGKGGALCFAVLGPYDGNPATVGNGTMIGFRFHERSEVDAFHAKAISLGGKDEGAPGVRGGPYYMSYVRDPDGNKLCAFHDGA